METLAPSDSAFTYHDVDMCFNGIRKWKTWPGPRGLYHGMSVVQWMYRKCIDATEVTKKMFTFFGGCKIVQFDIRPIPVDLWINVFRGGF